MDMLFRDRRYKLVVSILFCSLILFAVGHLSESGFVQLVTYTLGIFTAGVAVQKGAEAYRDKGTKT